MSSLQIDVYCTVNATQHEAYFISYYLILVCYLHLFLTTLFNPAVLVNSYLTRTLTYMRSYIGVSGVTNPRHVQQISELVEVFNMKARDLVVGVKATDKTIMRNMENKYTSAWYPVAQEFGDVFVPNSGVKMVAQVFMNPAETFNTRYHGEFLDRINKYCDYQLDGIQFDMLDFHLDPDGARQVLAAAKSYDVDVLVQIHGPAQNALTNKQLADLFNEYAELVDVVLFDTSHGRGVEMDVTKTLNNLNGFTATCATPVAVAGGLSPANLELIKPILEAYPHCSFDAEGSLHDADKKFNISTGIEFLRTGLNLV